MVSRLVHAPVLPVRGLHALARRQGLDEGHERVPDLLLSSTPREQDDLVCQTPDGLADRNDAGNEANEQRQRAGKPSPHGGRLPWTATRPCDARRAEVVHDDPQATVGQQPPAEDDGQSEKYDKQA